MKPNWRGYYLPALLLAFATLANAQLIPTYVYSGASPGSDYGESVNPAGDVNADGYDDFIVGSSGDDTAAINAGRAVVYSGFDGTVLHTILGPSSGAFLGFSTSGIGDIDADGHADFVVSDIPLTTSGFGPGRAHMISGLTGAVLATHVGDSNNDVFGYCVSDAGDVDGDGTPDIVVGAPFDDNNGTSSGSVRVISGATFLTLYSFDGATANAVFGRSVSRAGDVNGDGFGDVIVGAPEQFGGLSTPGNAYIFSGIDGSILYNLTGGAMSIQFGHVVSCAGDVDLDGFDDVIVGAPGANLGMGNATIFSGQTGAVITNFSGAFSAGQFGQDVSDCGDVNGDGFPDVLITERGASGGTPPMIYIYSGLSGALLDSLTGAASTGLDIRASGVGDVNGDGFSDVIVGRKVAGGSGRAQVFTATRLPILKYRSQNGLSALDLEWQPMSGGINDLNGILVGSGASALAMGLYGYSLAPADLPVFGFDLLIAVDQTLNLVGMGTFNFDGTGEFTSGLINRQHPAIAGSEVHVQWFEIAPNLGSSNGIRLRMEP